MKRNDNSDADSEEETEDDRKDLLNYGTDTFGVNFSKQIKQKRGICSIIISLAVSHVFILMFSIAKVPLA